MFLYFELCIIKSIVFSVGHCRLKAISKLVSKLIKWWQHGIIIYFKSNSMVCQELLHVFSKQWIRSFFKVANKNLSYNFTYKNVAYLIQVKTHILIAQNYTILNFISFRIEAKFNWILLSHWFFPKIMNHYLDTGKTCLLH